jgi:predicted transposase YbfD/YdcC
MELDCLVSIDAMGCQKEIAQTIIEEKGNYVLALKKNHPNLYQDVVGLFQFAHQQEWKGIEHQFYQTIMLASAAQFHAFEK